MEVGVDAIEGERFVPNKAMYTQHWFPMELDQTRLTISVDEPKRVHTEPFHHPKRAWDCAVGHGPHQHVRRLGEH